ncbi:MAG: 4-alpha-glucanotransferase [Planctomycetes bacterium]|nr:4-alpha-glucanotransferase [Planctomycetota bacterium]
MQLTRASGILCHITSLPSRWGIGGLGPEVRWMIEFLRETGQRVWQFLPLGPVGGDWSPFQCSSSFAGNPLLLSPEVLADDGLLRESHWESYPHLPEDRVDFEAVAAAKERLCRAAFERFRSQRSWGEPFSAFLERASEWLPDFSLFMAIRRAQDGACWWRWPRELAERRPGAIEAAREQLSDEVLFQQFLQFSFDKQWVAACAMIKEGGITTIGDLPFYCAHDSADVWAHQDLFQLDEHGESLFKSGVPPDLFQEDGQLWGDPVYAWDAHAREQYSWLTSRMQSALDRVDVLRLDHFRAFQAYWAIPGDSPTAKRGRWATGPGIAFFDALRRKRDCLPLIAEDLGVITPDVDMLRSQLGLPGMQVLQFGFGADEHASRHLPHSFPANSVVYTGTHDNDTARGWFENTRPDTTQSEEVIRKERDHAMRYLDATDAADIHWKLIRAALSSVASLAVIPMQDVLGLGTEARMNLPGTANGHWRWRFTQDAVTPAIRHRLAELAKLYER